MSSLIQNLIAIALVAGCAAYAGWQLLRTVRAGNGKAGSCCSKGCGGQQTPADAVTTPREQFIPSDSLRRRR